MTLNEYRVELAQQLKQCSGDDASFEADCILAEILHCSNSLLVLEKGRELTSEQIAAAKAMLDRRLNGEPLQYIFGKWEFYGNEFFVGGGVLIPRPETEMLVDAALSFIKGRKAPVVFDLCSGSGCIGISVAKAVPSARCYLLEKSDDAFHYLKKNIAHNKVNNTFAIDGDLFDGVFCEEKADIILSNPPYIKSSEISSLQREVQNEPAMALDGGADGLMFYRCIAEKWLGCLKSDGMLAAEIGDEQGRDAKAIFGQYFECVDIFKDYSGCDRVVAATNKKQTE